MNTKYVYMYIYIYIYNKYVYMHICTYVHSTSALGKTLTDYARSYGCSLWAVSSVFRRCSLRVHKCPSVFFLKCHQIFSNVLQSHSMCFFNCVVTVLCSYCRWFDRAGALRTRKYDIIIMSYNTLIIVCLLFLPSILRWARRITMYVCCLPFLFYVSLTVLLNLHLFFLVAFHHFSSDRSLYTHACVRARTHTSQPVLERDMILPGSLSCGLT
jgi:hypothetical protein